MTRHINDYKKIIYKYWPSFEDWKIWVNYQLQNRNQRSADPNVMDPNRKVGAVLLTLILPEKIWTNQENNYLDHIYVILEHRSKKMNKNPDDVSFPGGKMDPEDKDPVDTALREANEEVGLTVDNLHVIDTMDEFVSSSMMVVHPVVAWKVLSVNPTELYQVAKAKYYPHTEETDEVYLVPLMHLVNEEHYMSTQIKFLPAQRNVFIRFFSIDDHRPETHIWGLTASILRRFIDIVFPGNGLPEEIIQ